MLTVKNIATRGPGRKPEFPGLSEDAATLEVSRYFLWKVLKGFATSAPLLARYRKLHPGFKPQTPSPNQKK
jgi:hypothetical protein